jgi:hypothetical protein
MRTGPPHFLLDSCHSDQPWKPRYREFTHWHMPVIGRTCHRSNFLHTLWIYALVLAVWSGLSDKRALSACNTGPPVPKHKHLCTDKFGTKTSPESGHDPQIQDDMSQASQIIKSIMLQWRDRCRTAEEKVARLKYRIENGKVPPIPTTDRATLQNLSIVSN